MSDTNSGDGTKVGRPFLFTDPKLLAVEIQTYFDMCDPHIETRLVEDVLNAKGQYIINTREVLSDQMPYTVTGLARHLKVSRQTLLDYKKPEHFSDEIEPQVRQQLMDTIEDAYQRVEEFNEQKLFVGGLANGVKFSLTNNFGWVDKSVVENNTLPVEDELDKLDQDKKDVAEQAKKELEGSDEAAGPETQ